MFPAEPGLAAAAAAARGPSEAVPLVRVARAASARHSTFPGSSAAALAVAAECPVTLARTVPVAGATNPGVPGPAAGPRSPVAPAAIPPESGSAGIAVAVARIVRGIFP